MRRYGDPVEVRRRDDDPAEFLWHGRLYLVRRVLARWCEAGRWWRTPAASAVTAGAAAPASGPDVDDREREFWRVEAAAGRHAGIGVYDLCFDWSAGSWSLARALD